MKAAIYCRLSDEDRDKLDQNDDSVSIQNQKAMLVGYAKSNGWTIYDIYSDDNYTGSDRSRPAFNRLIRDAGSRKFDIVLCKTQSRFTRELELVESYIHGLFREVGIRFVSIADHGDTENKGNKKSRQINGLVNEWFLEDLSENIKAVLTSRRQKGLHIGSFAPYGYMKDPAMKGHLIIDPEAAEVVRQVFSLFAQGHGKQAIVQILNQSGIPNPTAYKRLHGMIRNKNKPGGTLWNYNTVSQMLTNEVYIGNMVQGKAEVISYKTQEKSAVPQEKWIIVKGTHEPIIDQALWNTVQSLIAQKAGMPSRGTPGIFAGKVRCAHCGCRMRSTKSGDKRGFKCKTHAASHDACIGANISLRKLERIVAAQLHGMSEALLDQEELERGIDLYPDLRRKRTQLEAEIDTCQRKIDGFTTGLSELYIDKLRGIVSEEAFLDMSGAYARDRSRLAGKIDDCRREITRIDRTLATETDNKLLVQQYLGGRYLTREMTEILIDQIFVGKRDPVTDSTPVEIYWNF